MIKAVFVDLDGTMLNSKEEITDRTKEAIHKCIENNIKIIISSGRPINTTLKLQKMLRTSPYLVSSNGAVAFDAKEEKELLNNSIDKDIAYKLLEYSHKNDYKIAIQYGKEEVINEAYYEDEKDKIKDYSELEKIVKTKKIIQCVICNRQMEKMYVLEEYINKIPQIKILNKSKRMTNPKLPPSKSYYCDIANANSSKGEAVKAICQYLGLNADEIAVVGDGDNDISMFKLTKNSICMANAIEFVKAEANFLTASNDEDGLAKVLEHIVKTKNGN